MYKLGPRKGDAAMMVILELVDRPEGDEEGGAGVTGAARNLLGRVRRSGGRASSERSEKPEQTQEEKQS